MAIYSPPYQFSPTEKALLHLLAHLLTSSPIPNYCGNLGDDELLLSDADAHELYQLISTLIQSPKLVASSTFVDSVFGETPNLSLARKIYLDWRARYGRTRVAATAQWEDFLARVGLAQRPATNPRVWFRSSARKMDFEHFVRMEKILAESAGLSRQAGELVIHYVTSRRELIERIREGEERLPNRSTFQIGEQLKTGLAPREGNPIGRPPVSAQRLSAMMTLVLDFSTLFTTRDWSVTGFISTIAAALPTVTMDR